MRAHDQVLGPIAERGLDQPHRQREHRVGILAAGPALRAHALVAEVGQAHVVELEVPAARRVEVGDLGSIRGGGVLHEAVEIRVHARADVGAPDLRVQHARRRDRELGGARGDTLQEPERIDEYRRRSRHPRIDLQVGPREVHVTRPSVERHGPPPPLAGQTTETGEKVHVPRPTSHLAVGDTLQAGGFLQAHRLADRRILCRGEGGSVRAPFLRLEAQRLQGRGPQQAADVVGAEGRARGGPDQ
jgi:hypothetical protein